MVGPRVYHLKHARSYPAFTAQDPAKVMDLACQWLKRHDFRIKRKNRQYSRGHKRGVHVNFVPKFKLYIEQGVNGQYVVRFDYYAKIKLGTAVVVGVLTSGISTVVGVGTLAINLADADHFVDKFWKHIDSLARGAPVILTVERWASDGKGNFVKQPPPNGPVAVAPVPVSQGPHGLQGPQGPPGPQGPQGPPPHSNAPRSNAPPPLSNAPPPLSNAPPPRNNASHPPPPPQYHAPFDSAHPHPPPQNAPMQPGQVYGHNQLRLPQSMVLTPPPTPAGYPNLTKSEQPSGYPTPPHDYRQSHSGHPPPHPHTPPPNLYPTTSSAQPNYYPPNYPPHASANHNYPPQNSPHHSYHAPTPAGHNYPPHTPQGHNNNNNYPPPHTPQGHNNNNYAPPHTPGQNFAPSPVGGNYPPPTPASHSSLPPAPQNGFSSPSTSSNNYYPTTQSHYPPPPPTASSATQHHRPPPTPFNHQQSNPPPPSRDGRTTSAGSGGGADTRSYHDNGVDILQFNFKDDNARDEMRTRSGQTDPWDSGRVAAARASLTKEEEERRNSALYPSLSKTTTGTSSR